MHKSIWERFVSSLVARTKAMKIGDPMDDQTTVGATISPEHAHKVLSYIENAVSMVRLSCSHVANCFMSLLLCMNDGLLGLNGSWVVII